MVDESVFQWVERWWLLVSRMGWDPVLVSEKTWAAVGEAVLVVCSGRATKVEGDGWKVYRVGSIVRVDLSVSG